MHWFPGKTRLRKTKYAVVLMLCWPLSACTDLYDSRKTPVNPGTDSSQTVGDGMALTMPAAFAGLRAVFRNNLYAVLTINENAPRRFELGEQLTATFRVERGDLLTGTLEWYETLPGITELLLASYTIEETIDGPVELNIDRLDYVTQGAGFDEDNDGFSNLRERLAGSDALNASETPLATPDVRIGSINASDAPLIDGRYDEIYNTGAQFNDVNGESLDIDNLMIDNGALRINGDTEFRWFAMHDDEFLYIFILGEANAFASPNRDSTEFFQDDSIEIFVDADNSKGSIYDGVDDRQITIPLLTSPDDLSENRTSIVAGMNSASLPPVTFATCLCDGQATWEIALALDGFGIRKDTLFGFEVQLNEDHNGGARDAKWGWHHPARLSVDVDNTFRNPSFMGTAVIN